MLAHISILTNDDGLSDGVAEILHGKGAGTQRSASPCAASRARPRASWIAPLTQFRFESDGRRARSGLGDLEDRPSDRENDAARLAIVAQTSMIDGARNVELHGSAGDPQLPAAAHRAANIMMMLSVTMTGANRAISARRNGDKHILPIRFGKVKSEARPDQLITFARCLRRGPADQVS